MAPPDRSQYAQGARDVLLALCADLCAKLDARGCTISRVVGDLLVDLVEFAPDGRRLQLGHGYLISDYPLTREVLEQREARMVSLLDPDPEPNEARLLVELGFTSLLMLPLVVGDELWGLVEVYRTDKHPFVADDVVTAEPLVAGSAEALRSTR
jgi:GAF domain-containing protein